MARPLGVSDARRRALLANEIGFCERMRVEFPTSKRLAAWADRARRCGALLDRLSARFDQTFPFLARGRVATVAPVSGPCEACDDLPGPKPCATCLKTSPLSGGARVRATISGEAPWVGPFADFVRSNAESFERHEMDDIARALAEGRVYRGFGFVGSTFTVERLACDCETPCADDDEHATVQADDPTGDDARGGRSPEGESYDEADGVA